MDPQQRAKIEAENHRVKQVALSIPRHYLSCRTASGRNGERWSIARKMLGLSYGPLPEGLTLRAV